MCYKVYEPKLCFKMVMQYGVGSKNLKAVAECLDMVAAYVKENGVDTITKKDFAVFLEKANSPDKNVRENSLRVFAETYKVLKEDIWRLLGKDINAKVKGLLEQRFKQTMVANPSNPNNSSMGGPPNNLNKSRGLNASMGGSNGLKFNANNSIGKAPAANVQEITNQMESQNLDEQPIRPARKFSRSRSPQPHEQPAEDRPIQPAVDNRRDVQMQDVFSGKAQIPGQQDEVMQPTDDQPPPDEVAQVVR